MAVELKQYVELRGENPLDAVMIGTHLNAWLVANFAIGWSVEEAMEQYDLSRAQIHGALAFFYQNKPAIDKAIEEAEAFAREVGVDSRTKLEEIRRRQQSS